jgi:cell division protein FtsA
MSRQHIISAIDIGTDKICTIIATKSEETNTLQVLGVASVPSRGIRKSQVVDLDDTIEAITKSLDSAERMAGFSITTAYVSISGTHVASQNSKGVVAVANPDSEITGDDVRRVIEAARAISLPSAREVIHVIPREFKVDSQDGIKDPIGMSGVRLEAEAHIVTGSATALRNVAKCVSEVGVNVSKFVFAGLASSYAVLSETEKELGVVVLDIGAGSTALAAFVDGALTYSCVLPIGARHITQDIALGSHVSLASAEKIKIALSNIPVESAPVKGESREEARERKRREDELDVHGLGLEEDVHSLSRRTLLENIMYPRMKEMFEMVGAELEKQKLFPLVPAGLVLTGGGSQTAGIVEVCKRTLSMSTRLGIPTGVKGLVDEIEIPSYSSVIGLLLYGAKEGGEEVSAGGMGGKFGSVFSGISTKGLGILGKIPSLIKSLFP